MSSKSNDKSNQIEKTIIEGLICPICFECPNDPVETECCHKFLCNACMQGMEGKCPYCRKECIYSGSVVAQRILDNLDHECEFCKVVNLRKYF